MFEQIYTYFTLETLYLWINIAVLPFWLILIFFPQSYLCKYLVTSILPIFLLTGCYVFILYKGYLDNFDAIGNFNLYLGIEYLLDLFDNEYFLILFWVHFLSINLFTGGWILSDSRRYNINKILIAFPLISTYLVGPAGLFLYWIIRIFYSKRFSLFD
jgi:hypothetical protein